MEDKENKNFEERKWEYEKLEDISVDDTNIIFESDDPEEIYSYGSLLKEIALMSLNQFVFSISTSIRFTLLFIFSRTYDLNFLVALGLILPAFQFLNTASPSALTQGVGFLVAYYYGKKEYHNIGLVYNKAMFINVVLGLVINIIFFFFGTDFYSLLVSSESVLYNVNILIKMISISGVFSYIQFVSTRTFMGLHVSIHLTMCAIVGVASETIFLALLNIVAKWIPEGTGFAFSITLIIMASYCLIVFNHFNPHPSTLIPFDFKETLDGLWDFIKYTVPRGVPNFLNQMSTTLLPYYGAISGEIGLAAYAASQSLIFLIFIFGQSVSLANVTKLNKAMGENKNQYISRIIFASALIVIIYAVVLLIILFALYSKITAIVTTDTNVLKAMSEYEIWFVLTSFALTIAPLLSDSLTCLNTISFPIIALVIGRFIFPIALGFSLAKLTNFGIGSVFFAYFIGIMASNLANFLKLYFVVSNILKKSKIDKVKQNKLKENIEKKIKQKNN